MAVDGNIEIAKVPQLLLPILISSLLPLLGGANAFHLMPFRGRRLAGCSNGLDIMFLIDRYSMPVPLDVAQRKQRLCFRPRDCPTLIAPPLTSSTSADLRVWLRAFTLRSKSIGDTPYRDYDAPFIAYLVNAVQNLATPTKRMGVIVFSGQTGGVAAGQSGLACIRVPLSRNLSRSTALQKYSTILSYANDAKLACSDTMAESRLCMPCSGWKFTSSWTALQQADAQLYDGTYTSDTKVVVVIADGALERNNNQGTNYRRAWPTYLSVRQAKLLKDKGASILGVGYSSTFTGSGGASSFGPCHPMCTGA